MNVYATEEEQIEKLKTWFKKYSVPLILAVLIGLGGGYGWRSWQQYRVKKLLQASMFYQAMIGDFDLNKNKRAKSRALQLIQHYPTTPYAAVANLMLARLAIYNHQYLVAEKRLEWVVAHSKNNAFRQIARNRSARVYIIQGKPQQALAILKKVNDPNFETVTQEIKGDAYLALNNQAAAKKAYLIALKTLPKNAPERPVLKMKYYLIANPSEQSLNQPARKKA